MDNENKLKNWYAYISGSPFDCENYFLILTKPHHVGIGKTISAIYATSNGLKPEEFSVETKTEIANALAMQVPQPVHSNYPTVLLKS
ncbi:hypothetical protein [Pedobacter sp. L105]|uniref:hypothetical protein n=1 Tax=Pedobacter sp. L105 TaxID=1641871 RepID=UPI00131EC61B|nr:hypothetical protein [Pedobacter sp. L105]